MLYARRQSVGTSESGYNFYGFDGGGILEIGFNCQ